MMERSSRRLRAITWFMGLALVAGIAGCAPASNQDQQGSDSLLREMVANDRQQIEELQQRVSRLDDRIAEMEHNGVGSSEKDLDSLEARVSKLETQASPTPPPGAPGAPPGMVAPVPGAAPSPGAADSDTGDTDDSETASAATPAPAVPPPAAPAPAEGPAATAPSWRSMLDQELNTSHDDDGAKIYRSGLIDLKAGKYAQGVGKLQDLQRKYPKSGLSEPAEFFAGNGLFELGKYDQAILQFNDLTMRFPTGHYATASLLREAQAFVKINDPIDARLTLQKLITEHPDAPEAPMAKSMMETLANG
jgi:TolA-binding protein